MEIIISPSALNALFTLNPLAGEQYHNLLLMEKVAALEAKLVQVKQCDCSDACPEENDGAAN